MEKKIFVITTETYFNNKLHKQDTSELVDKYEAIRQIEASETYYETQGWDVKLYVNGLTAIKGKFKVVKSVKNSLV